MKTILRRKDSTSIYCPSIHQHSATYKSKTKVIKLTIACSLLMAGIFIITISQ